MHLRQALVSLAVEDVADAQHHITHVQSLAGPDDEEGVSEVLELLEQREPHGAEHEIQELLGEHHD